MRGSAFCTVNTVPFTLTSNVLSKCASVILPGYEGTSQLADLTKAMRINRPSLYAAFGNKEDLFLKVVDRYDRGPAGYAHGAGLAVQAASGAPRRELRQVADVFLRTWPPDQAP